MWCSTDEAGGGRTHISTHRIPSHDLIAPDMLAWRAVKTRRRSQQRDDAGRRPWLSSSSPWGRNWWCMLRWTVQSLVLSRSVTVSDHVRRNGEAAVRSA